ncbi:MAG TPA: DegT/DnrJ/EryC1/StrS family aminotransferase [Thermomicrobiales bacterium]|nr:DegT/DnrJ/EryC1/StrS family aminotransferase [Thermomicrobiales bacterium]
MAELDQSRAPFFDALAAYAGLEAVPFSTPGHKRGRGAPDDLRTLLPDALALDIPHGGGVDTTHFSLGLLREAERLAAEAYGGDAARFLVNGSTTGNLAILLSTCGNGDTVIVSRMLHKSLLTGLIFSGARPHYLAPAIDDDRNLPLDIEPAAVAGALDVYPDAKAVVIVSPSYVGVSSDLAAIAAICHGRGVPLLVDEAWGPHFRFHPDLPPSAMECGADAAVSSTHKMLAGLTQSSTLVARAGRLELDRMSTIVDMVQTTSPSALIFASMDASRRQMALDGRRLLDGTLAVAQRMRTGLAAIDGLEVLSPALVADRPGAGFDPTRVIVDVHGLGLTGYEAEHVLRNEHGVYVEMSDLLSVMLLVTIGDDERSIDRAVAGFQSLTTLRKPPRHAAAARSTGDLLFARLAELTPQQAFTAPAEVVPVGQAAGRISTESITPYPPGIPLVAPGERLTQDVIDYLRAGIEEGMYVSGLADASFATVRVVR